VRPGYKRTDVGVIPDDWAVERFERLAHIERGKFTARPRNDPRYYGGDIPFIQTGDVTNAGGQITTYSQSLNAAGLKVSKMFPRGTLFFTIAANIGDVGFAAFDTACPDSIVAITPSGATDKTWLSYEVANRKKSFESIATHNAQLNINLEKLRPYLLPHPPLAEQRAIATALSDVDALLGSLDRLIAKKRDLKQAAMQELLTGQTRLPGFDGEWEVMRLDALAEIRSGGTPSTDESRFWNGDIPWCTPTDITALSGQKYLCVTTRTITQLGLKASSAEMIPAYSVVMTSRATIGECAINVAPVSTNQGFKNFVPFETTDVDFLFYLLASQKQGFTSLCTGSTFLEIGKTQLTSYQVQLPPSKVEQVAIAKVLTDMDDELTALTQRREKTHALKQAMMQELLTGRTRLV
jgi:type I restriction enzyme, S subunit